APYYAKLYRRLGLYGGHVILLNSADSEYYEETKKQALAALEAYPGGMMAGGGITPDNAGEYLDAGASHVIVTSFVFKDGRIDLKALEAMEKAVGKEHLCLDLSCRKRGREHFIVTDRWQKFTDEKLDAGVLEFFADYASEFLIHAVDAEGRQKGIDEDILPVLIKSPIPVTYAGGVGELSDIIRLKEAGAGRIDVTVGSALSIFGGTLDIEEILRCIS
ncbi:MAG: phosphoribosylformimino-5-aminoimidazole carboxamide ribotide isomerase, partial [Lachnospiraceae bacterium]|nr:phosphoribosylformimino-5-aminoimidazole carboxamide ribotide isomerase [Lachnospiraceae bacterium]